MKKIPENSKPIPYEINFVHEVFYIESLISITRSALAEKNVIITILEQIETGNFENKKLLVDAVQNLINYAASLSRFFWATAKHSKKRGQKLRQALLVKESSAIKNREVRNFIEHFDEKLDAYLSTYPATLIIPLYVGSRISEEAKKIFRAYFIDEAVFKVLDLEYKLIPIIKEIERIHIILEEKIETGRL